jgi:hypothetical protein
MTAFIKPTGIINAAVRNSMPADTFGLPAQRKYPMPDKSHAANAKARATQMVKAGKLSQAGKTAIDAKANQVLGHPHRNLGKFLHPSKAGRS